MKKLVLLALLVTVGLSYGQETEIKKQDKKEKIITSTEEYNYLTKGYADDLEKGKDIKDGYELKEFYKFDTKKINFKFTYYKFIETATKKTKAILVVGVKKSKKKKKFLCIPFNNKELITQSLIDVNDIGVTMTAYYKEINYFYLTNLLSKTHNE